MGLFIHLSPLVSKQNKAEQLHVSLIFVLFCSVCYSPWSMGREIPWNPGLFLSIENRGSAWAFLKMIWTRVLLRVCSKCKYCSWVVIPRVGMWAPALLCWKCDKACGFIYFAGHFGACLQINWPQLQIRKGRHFPIPVAVQNKLGKGHFPQWPLCAKTI